jgi:hypothetical protein
MSRTIRNTFLNALITYENSILQPFKHLLAIHETDEREFMPWVLEPGGDAKVLKRKSL